MKRIFKTIACLLALALCICAFCACEEKEDAPVTALTRSAREIADAVRAGADFSGASFVASDEADADLVLMFNYCIESDEMIGAIEDYVLSTQDSPEYPAFFSVIRVKDGTDPAIISAMAEAVKAGYPQFNIDQMVKYDPTGLTIAQGFTVKTYDNGIIVTAYNENGNDEIIALAEAACRAE